MTLKISRSQVSTQPNPTQPNPTQPNPTQPMDGPNPWPTLRLITCCGHTVSTAIPTHSLTLSPFNGHIPGGPGLADTRMSPFWILLELRTMEVVSGDNWSYKTCRTPVKSSSPTNRHPVFYWPSCGPPVSVWIRVHDVPLWTIKSEAIDPAAG